MTTHDCGCVKAIPCARNRSVSAFAPDATARVTVATNAHALAGMSFTPLIRKQIHEKSAFRQSLLVLAARGSARRGHTRREGGVALRAFLHAGLHRSSEPSRSGAAARSPKG